MEGLTPSGTLAYTDTTYTGPYIRFGVNLEGRTAPRAPEWTGNITFDWTRPISRSWELGVTGNASFSSEYFTNDDSFLDYVNPSYTNLVATVRLGQIDGPFSVSLVGINITDEIWVNTAGGRPFLSPTGDDQVYTQNRGRQMFLETAIKF